MRLVLAISLGLVLYWPAIAESRERARASQHTAVAATDSVLAFVRNWVSHGEFGDDPDSPSWYVVAPMAVDGAHGPAFVVYLMGWPWCGINGCTMLVVTRDSTA